MSVSPSNDPRRQPDSLDPTASIPATPGPESTPTPQPPVLPPANTADAVSPAAAASDQRSYVAGIVTAGIAAVCGAIFTSWLGAQGTLAGAMIGATIGSSVSEIVRAPLTSLERRLLQVGISARQLRRDGLLTTILTSPAAAQQALGMISRRGILTVAVVSVVGFGLAMGGVTAVEVARGEPLAAIVSDDQTTGTTVGQVIPNPPPVLAPATVTPTITAAQATGRAGGPSADPQIPSARGGGGQPGLALSPTSDRADNTSGAPDLAGSPQTAGGSPETVIAVIGSASTTPTPATGTPGALTPTVSAQASAQPSQTAAAIASATSGAATATMTATPTHPATSGMPGAPEVTTTALTPGATSAAGASTPSGAPTSAPTAVPSSVASPAGAAAPTPVPTSAQTPASAASSTPTRTPTPTSTPTQASGASTPAAPPATLPPAPQT